VETEENLLLGIDVRLALRNALWPLGGFEAVSSISATRNGWPARGFVKQSGSRVSNHIQLNVGARASVVCWGVMPSVMLRHPLFLSWAERQSSIT
jgi:hypothetical protein